MQVRAVPSASEPLKPNIQILSSVRALRQRRWRGVAFLARWLRSFGVMPAWS
jgi:hypothetical protein